MKTTILALVLSISVSGLAQPVESCKKDWHGNIKCALFDDQPKPSHKFRNILIGAGVAAGVGAAIVISHPGSAASNGSSGNYPSHPLIPIVTVHK